MAEQTKKKPGILGRALKIFLLIIAVLLVPVVMDQLHVDREKVRMVGRVAGGLTLLLILYSMVAKVMKIGAFVLLALVAVVVLMTEKQIEFPRLKAKIEERQDSGERK